MTDPATVPAPVAPVLDMERPLVALPNQEELWLRPGDAASLDAAIETVARLDAEDGERSDVRVENVSEWAFGPAYDLQHAAFGTRRATNGDRHRHPLRWLAFSQLCQRLGAPPSYLRRIPCRLQMACLNWACGQRAEEGLMVRLAGDQARAIVSLGYGQIDNPVALSSLRIALRRLGLLSALQVRSLAVGPTSSLRLALPGDGAERPGPQQRPEDVLEVGVELINGELGTCAVSLSAVVIRRTSALSVRLPDPWRRRHIGSSANLRQSLEEAIPLRLEESRGLRQALESAADQAIDDLLAEFTALRGMGLGEGELQTAGRAVMRGQEVELPSDVEAWPDAFRAQQGVSLADMVDGVCTAAAAAGTDRRLELELVAGKYLQKRSR